MSEKSNDTAVGHAGLEIAPMAFTTLVGSLLEGAEYWNLHVGGLASANFEGAWVYATGKNVLVGLVDEGVNYTHLDLSGSYATGLDYDPRDDLSSLDAMPDDLGQQHGTEVAGIIAGSIHNTIGTIGAAPDATITASYLRYGPDVTMTELVEVLSQQSGFDVANNSWGFTSAFADNFHDGYFSGISNQLENAVTNGRNGLGTALVMAGGNGKFNIEGENFGDDSNFHNLSNSRYVIAVGAHNADGQSAFFSSPGTNLLISAPGVGLVTTGGNSVGSQSSTYVSGTSFAAPLVSSAIALMLEVNPDLGYRDIQKILAITAKSSGAPGATSNGALNFNGSGLVFDREMGFGTLDAAAAVKLAQQWTEHSTASNEEHLGGSFLLPTQFGPTSQSIDVTIDNPGDQGFSVGFVELTLEISDTDLRNLSIELVSPNGTKALIAPNLYALGNQTYLNFTFSSVVTWGEDPFGTWTVNLTHASPSDNFSVLDAKIDIYGDARGIDDTYYFTSAYQRLVADDPNRSTIADLNGGIDTLNFAAASGGVVIDLAGGANALAGASITLDDGFENAVGTSDNDRLSGSFADNLLIGFYGNDSISGRGGNDVLKGGDGNDLLAGGAGGDMIDGGNGVDTADYADSGSGIGINLDSGQHWGDAAGDTLLSIEAFRFGAFADTFTGASGNTAETVYGGGGSDMLDGGGGADWLDGGVGADTMIGGGGNDVFVVDNAGDNATDIAGGGLDTVRASASYSLRSNVENLTLTGSQAINGTGNALGNVLVGNAAANILNGGAGNDRLVGGNGNDTYIIDSARDLVVEQAGQGVDRVRSLVSHALAANVDNLQLLGHAYSGAGNALANVMEGTASANFLNGVAGNDRLFGFGGIDILHGGLGSDILNGGTGNDRLVGGTGNDTYIIDSARDVVVELVGQGVDKAWSYASHALAANVENLQLAGQAYSGQGNALANLIQGNASANFLAGAAGNDRLLGLGGNDVLHGGLGFDVLYGGAGRDTFDFNHFVESGNGRGAPDIIADFVHGLDRVDLSGIDANTTLAGNQAFSFLGGESFSGRAGELIVRTNYGSTYVSADLNGDTHADMQIRLIGRINLTASDFIL